MMSTSRSTGRFPAGAWFFSVFAIARTVVFLRSPFIRPLLGTALA